MADGFGLSEIGGYLSWGVGLSRRKEERILPPSGPSTIIFFFYSSDGFG
jgi:hypothetical protein